MKIRRYGWGWIFLLAIYGYVMTQSGWLQKYRTPFHSMYTETLGFVGMLIFYFWLRKRIINFLIKKGKYDDRFWIAPLISLIVSYVFIGNIVVLIMILFH